MSQTRQSQATQDPATQKTDKDIMADVVKSRGHHIISIGPTLRRSVLDQRGSSSRPSSKVQMSAEEVHAIKAELATIKAGYAHFYNYMAKHHPESILGHEPPPPPSMPSSSRQPRPPIGLDSDSDDNDDEEEQEDANLDDEWFSNYYFVFWIIVLI